MSMRENWRDARELWRFARAELPLTAFLVVFLAGGLFGAGLVSRLWLEHHRRMAEMAGEVLGASVESRAQGRRCIEAYNELWAKIEAGRIDTERIAERKEQSHGEVHREARP